MAVAPKLLTKSFAGRSFFVANAVSVGFPEHTNSASSFDEAEPVLCELEKIRPHQVFVDIGCQYGSYALPALAMGARVHAFEPTWFALETFRASVKANGWSGRCESYRAALFDGGLYPEALGAEVFTKHYPSEGHPVRTLDEVLLESTRFDGVHWIKIDVEGAELGVLTGARQILERWHPTLLIEDHDGIAPGCAVSDYPASIDSSWKIHQMLSALGYAIHDVPWGCGRKYIVASV